MVKVTRDLFVVFLIMLFIVVANTVLGCARVEYNDVEQDNTYISQEDQVLGNVNTLPVLPPKHVHNHNCRKHRGHCHRR